MKPQCSAIVMVKGIREAGYITLTAAATIYECMQFCKVNQISIALAENR